MVGNEVSQVALSVKNLKHSVLFYQTTFGFRKTGSNPFIMGNRVSRLMGLTRVRAKICWLTDDQDFIQLELFQFGHPFPNPRPADWSPADDGYQRISILVSNYEATLIHLGQFDLPLFQWPVCPVGKTA